MVLICLAACVWLVLRVKNHQAALLELEGQTNKLSLAMVETNRVLQQQEQVNARLESDLEKSRTREAEFVVISNKMVKEINDLSAERQALKKEAETVAQLLKDKEEKLAKSEARVTDLESQSKDLNAKLLQLSGSITNLENQILGTERKLAVSEGDREFLLKELKRLQAEKSELERQFNDLSALKSQVGKLRNELAIARRLEFIRYGLFGNMRGAELLTRREQTPTAKSNTFSLNVELNRGGGARILPPTNAPAPVKP